MGVRLEFLTALKKSDSPPPGPTGRRRGFHPHRTPSLLRLKLATQKARGIRTCLGCGPLWGSQTPRAWVRYCLYSIQHTHVGIVKATGQELFWGDNLSYPVFARPCPVRPRHGFVESRVVEHRLGLNKLLREVREADPDAEVFLMEHIKDAQWSGVVTNAGIVLGLGSDGATGGRKSFMLPVPKIPTKAWLGTKTPIDAGISTSPYLEVVASGPHRSRPYAVQLRDGPEPVGGTDYIPKPLKVRKIIVPPSDLMLWERTIADGLPRGSVVWIESGSLSCHAAVHALLHQIPIVCGTPAPVVGEILSPTDSPAKMKHDDYLLLARLISELWQKPWMRAEGSSGAAAVALCVGTLHALPAWDNDWRLVQLRAHGVVAMARLMAAACLGETRHWYSSHRNGDKYGVSTRCQFLEKQVNLDRADVWMAAGALRISPLTEACQQSVLDLKAPGWTPNYGGRKWVVAMNITIRLLLGLDKFMADPTPRRWRSLVNNWNRAVYVCHNGRVPVLTKWVPPDFITAIAQAPQLAFLPQENAAIALGLNHREVTHHE